MFSQFNTSPSFFLSFCQESGGISLLLTHMNLISTLLPLHHIHLDMDISSKKRLFECISEHIGQTYPLGKKPVFDSLFSREKLGSTGLGQGVAIPHGRLKKLTAPMGLFIRLKNPIDFDAPDGRPVYLICALLVPENADDEHLNLLGELAQFFSDKLIRDQLLASTAPEQILDLISAWQPDF